MARLIPVLLATALTGCGGEPSDREQIQTAFSQWTRDLADGNFADACRQAVEPPECIKALRTAEVMAGGRDELLVYFGVTDEVVEAAEDAKVTVNGDRATVDNPATEDDPGVEAVRRDGEWRFVFPGS